MPDFPTIKVQDFTATLTPTGWQCDDPTFLKILKLDELENPFITFTPLWMQEKAAQAARRLGGDLAGPSLKEALVTGLKGGKGSGNYGHAGRPGKLGGSADRPDFEHFAGYITSRYHRKNKAWYAMYNAEEAGLDTFSGKYALVCEKHNTVCNVTTKKLALSHLPWGDWCEDCQSTSEKGGPGSGNIGHAGRPGHRGGSAPQGAKKARTFVEYMGDVLDEQENGPVIERARQAGFKVFRSYDDLPPTPTGSTRIYHGTMSTNLASIHKLGLVNQRDLALQKIIKLDPESATPWVLFTSQPQGTGEEARFHGDSIVVVDQPASEMPKEGGGSELAFKKVPTSRIVGVYVPKIGIPEQGVSPRTFGLKDWKEFTAFIDRHHAAWLEKYGISEKGGDGSGNFQHAGRPGHVGGSAPQDVPGVGPVYHPDFRVDDILTMRSPFTGDETKVSYRGREGDKAVVYNPKTGFQSSVPLEWLSNPISSLTPEKIENTFLKLYPETGEGEAYQYSWIAPSGKLLGLGVDHQDSARNVMQALTGQNYRPEQVYDLVEDLIGKSGFVRVSIQPDSYVAFSAPVKPTAKQLYVIRKLRKMGGEDTEFTVDFPQSDHDPVWNWEDFSQMMADAYKGGKGSGNWSHAGRPGKRGGSQPTKSGEGSQDLSIPSDYRALLARFAPGVSMEHRADDMDPAYYQDMARKIRSQVKPFLAKSGLAFTRNQMEENISKAINQLWGEKGETYIGPETEAVLAIDREMRHEYDYLVKRAVTIGEIEPEAAEALSYEAAHPNGIWKPLPAETFHATVNSAAVKALGLKSRRERESSGGEGLGGGEDDVVCLTDRAEYAKTIERGLHEMSLCARGDLNVRKMYDLAVSGAGGVGHRWNDTLMRFSGSIFGTRATIEDLIAIDEGKAIKRDTWHIFDKEPDRPYTQDEIMQNRMSFLKTYMAARSDSGGFENPMFMFNDWKATAALDPAQFKVHVYKPANPKVKGAYLGPAEGEYRITGGDAVKLKRVIDFFKPDDLKAIYGER